jgi:hypothetical protein
MTKKTLVRIILAAVIALVLAGASLIVARNNPGAVGEAPSGFVH